MCLCLKAFIVLDVGNLKWEDQEWKSPSQYKRLDNPAALLIIHRDK